MAPQLLCLLLVAVAVAGGAAEGGLLGCTSGEVRHGGAFPHVAAG